MQISFDTKSFQKALKKGYFIQDILILLYLETKPLTLDELEEKLDLSKRTIFRSLKKLRENGYILQQYKGVKKLHIITEKTDELWD